MLQSFLNLDGFEILSKTAQKIVRGGGCSNALQDCSSCGSSECIGVLNGFGSICGYVCENPNMK